MSSTLFARGTNTQVGLRRRAEVIDKSISDMRATVEGVQDLPRDFRVLRARVEAVETYADTISRATKAVGELTEKVAVLEGFLSKITQIDSILERLTKLESMGDDIRTMEEEMETTTTRVKSCETIIEAQNAKITKLTSRINALEKAAAEAAAAAATADH